MLKRLNRIGFPRSVPFWCVVAGGCLVIITHALFTGVSIGMFPGPFSPMLHWLSDLGNVNYNPNGAIFFNTGCILTSLVLIIFFAGYSHWNFASRNKNSLLIASKLAGFFDAFTLAMLGIYPETTIYVHNIFAFMFFYTNMAFMILASITFFFHARSFKGVSIYGLLVAAISLAFLVLPVVPQILEWIVVVSSLGFVGMMVANAVFSVYKIK